MKKEPSKTIRQLPLIDEKQIPKYAGYQIQMNMDVLLAREHGTILRQIESITEQSKEYRQNEMKHRIDPERYDKPTKPTPYFGMDVGTMMLKNKDNEIDTCAVLGFDSSIEALDTATAHGNLILQTLPDSSAYAEPISDDNDKLATIYTKDKKEICTIEMVKDVQIPFEHVNEYELEDDNPAPPRGSSSAAQRELIDVPEPLEHEPDYNEPEFW